jgi:hypothetical protein
MAMAVWPQVQFFMLAALWGVSQGVVGIFLHRAKRRRLAAGVPQPRLV